MANDFSGDSDCKALWRFENNLTDSIGGNDLTGSGTIAYDTSDEKEGSYALDLANQVDFVYIDDADLDAGFPLKSGDTAKKGTFSFWFQPASFPSLTNRRIVLKEGTLVIWAYYHHLYVAWYYNSDGDKEMFDTDINLVAGEWFHITVLFDGVEKRLRICVYRPSTTTYETYTKTFTNELYVSDGAFCLGAYSDGSDGITGLFDEFVAFSDNLIDREIEEVRDGNYDGPITENNDFSGDSDCKALWRFENNLNDSIGNNDLTAAASGVTYTTTIRKEGSYGLDLHTTDNQWASIADADLDAGFPLKNGDTTKVISFALAFDAVANYIFAKYGTNNKRSLALRYLSGNLCLMWGYNGGASYLEWTIAAVTAGARCHVGVAVDGVNQTALVRLWDGVTATTYTKDDWGQELNVGDALLVIGNRSNLDTSYSGYLDEVVVFDRLLTADEFDQIRAGTYGASATNIKSINGVAYASLKSINGVARANMKSWNGVA